MTYQELSDHIESLSAQIAHLERRKVDILHDYLSQSPFKVGDRVLVVWGEGGHEMVVYVRAVAPCPVSPGGFRYSFNMVGADGTDSGVIAGIKMVDVKSISLAPKSVFNGKG